VRLQQETRGGGGGDTGGKQKLSLSSLKDSLIQRKMNTIAKLKKDGVISVAPLLNNVQVNTPVLKE
jgi:hypothetical protein